MSVEDCFDLATARHPQGGPEWYDAYDKCIQAGCAAGTIPDCN